MNVCMLDSYLKHKFGTKVYKISLRAAKTCPNRDGKVSKGGCIFCSAGGSGDFAPDFAPLEVQIQTAKKMVDSKFPRGGQKKYIAYFQSFSNTYGNQKYLMEQFLKASSYEEIVAISIATRPDCISREMILFLCELNKKKPVWVELGLQTVHKKSADFINRAYSLDVFETSYRLLKEAGLYVVAHVILGLPCETPSESLKTVEYLSGLVPHLDGIKLHMLQVLEGTALGELYKKEPFKILSLEEYTDLVIKCLKLLPPDTVVHRMTGDGPKKLLIAPLWSCDKKKVLNYMNKKIRDAK